MAGRINIGIKAENAFLEFLSKFLIIGKVVAWKLLLHFVPFFCSTDESAPAERSGDRVSRLVKC